MYFKDYGTDEKYPKNTKVFLLFPRFCFNGENETGTAWLQYVYRKTNVDDFGLLHYYNLVPWK